PVVAREPPEGPLVVVPEIPPAVRLLVQMHTVRLEQPLVRLQMQRFRVGEDAVEVEHDRLHRTHGLTASHAGTKAAKNTKTTNILGDLSVLCDLCVRLRGEAATARPRR